MADPAPARRLHGVVNASPDSLADFSVATTVEGAMARAAELLDQGCVGIDLGGAGSTQFAERVDIETEWQRLNGKIQALAGLCESRGAQLSVDSWQPEIMRRSLECGATMINAADGLQNPAMVRLAAASELPVVAPFVWGDDPKSSRPVPGDPVNTIRDWFGRSLSRWGSAGIH
ncbi:MAG: dihydropteroate synthase, partial [Acidimicrobiaceae bacterium]|nr:dihydropteroate synthase [Acidimicrobiaceae bacterium]